MLTLFAALFLANVFYTTLNYHNFDLTTITLNFIVVFDSWLLFFHFVFSTLLLSVLSFQGENFLSVEKDEIQVEIGGAVCEINRIGAREVHTFYRNSSKIKPC